MSYVIASWESVATSSVPSQAPSHGYTHHITGHFPFDVEGAVLHRLSEEDKLMIGLHTGLGGRGIRPSPLRFLCGRTGKKQVVSEGLRLCQKVVRVCEHRMWDDVD